MLLKLFSHETKAWFLPPSSPISDIEQNLNVTHSLHFPTLCILKIERGETEKPDVSCESNDIRATKHFSVIVF